MNIPFEKISDNARLWIYQADRKLFTSDLKMIEDKLSIFTDQWAAHGKQLESAFKIFHDQFLVIAVNESYNLASGCSIDASVHLVKELEEELQINFFDRTKIAFVLNDEVYLESLSNLKSKVEQGEITEDTLTFNNLISSKKDLEKTWLIPAKETWMSRYFD